MKSDWLGANEALQAQCKCISHPISHPALLALVPNDPRLAIWVEETGALRHTVQQRSEYPNFRPRVARGESMTVCTSMAGGEHAVRYSHRTVDGSEHRDEAFDESHLLWRQGVLGEMHQLVSDVLDLS